MKKNKRTLEQQVYIYQIFSVILTMILALGIALAYMISNERNHLDQNINNVSALLSSCAPVKETLEKKHVSKELNSYLDSVISNLDYIDIITICDTNSTRYYHTNPNEIGKHFVGGDESAILNGAAPYITDGEGTIGKQRRAFYPVKDDQGNIIGFVMVSVLTKSIAQLTRKIVFTYILLAIALVFIGIILSKIINMRLKNILLGYRPEEFTRMYIERTEILNSLEEGLFAINTKGELILINDSALKMLNLTDIPAPGTKLVDIYPETQLPRTLETRQTENNISLMMHGQNIISSRIPVIENDVVIGAVSIFRNKTEVTKLAEELTGAHYMVDTLRAFNHEFKNKLHVILGYIEMGQPDAASAIIKNSSMISTNAVSEVTRKIQNPSIAALLIGKILRASELQIHFILKQDSYCHQSDNFLPTDLYITILGNLIENALEELNQTDLEIKEVEIGLYLSNDGALITVDDTGRGIPEAIQQKIFQQGFSTKGENRGTGLYLIKDLVERYHGTLELDSEENIGTSFTITFIKKEIYNV